MLVFHELTERSLDKNTKIVYTVFKLRKVQLLDIIYVRKNE